jgi:hypothetical protein
MGKTMTRMIMMGVSAGCLLHAASSLDIYQDRTLYRYVPKHTFVGLTQNLQARCDNEPLVLETTQVCPQSQRLCTLYKKAQQVRTELLQNSANSKLLEQLVSLSQPRSIDAGGWIAAAKKISTEQTQLALQKERLNAENHKLKQRFARETRASVPLTQRKLCKGMLELTLPYGYVTFSTKYEAELSGKEIVVTQKLAVINHSGIDIVADEAHFYYRPAQQHVRPVHFSPWIIGEKKARPTKGIRKHTLNKMMQESPASMSVDAAAPMKVVYQDAREYMVKNLVLPSTGEEIRVPVMTWRAPVQCQEELYAYRNRSVFEVCTFTPKFQIEQNRWKIMKERKILNARAVGEYDQRRYRLYIRQDPDIKVIRKKVVLKERETGIFGGTVRKKDGFSLTLINKSDHAKKIMVTERIPTSTMDKIAVKLLSVDAPKGVTHTLQKEGKLKMDVALAPYESKKIEVLFEISYDKDMEIDY